MKQSLPGIRVLKYLQIQISRLIGSLCEKRWGWVTRAAIRWFISHYRVDMQAAQRENYKDYQNFSDFFTRRLKPGARSVDPMPTALVSPVDGVISQVGELQDHLLLQAKGRFYNLQSLLGQDQDLSASFSGGSFLTAYLSPKDYHRVHMPCEGRLLKTIYVPGNLFPVNSRAVDKVDELFSRNERLICVFETPHGVMALILVGALLVGNLCVAWEEASKKRRSLGMRVDDYSDRSLRFQKGEEMGYFTMGSTVITLFTKGAARWDSHCREGDGLCFGQKIGLGAVSPG